MHRQSHIIKTGIYPKLQQIFSSKKYKIFRSYQRQTAETYLTKVITVKDERVFKLYKTHIASNILPYLVSLKELKFASQLSLESKLGQIMVKADYQEDGDQDYEYQETQDKKGYKLIGKQKDSNTILISKKMIKGTTLREMILNKDKRLNEDFSLDLVGEIVDFLLARNRIKDLFITTQNIIVEDAGFISFNYFSFTGLQFIKYEKFITKVQFEELLPYLTPKLIAESINNPKQMDIEVDLRFIVLNYLSAYFKKDLLLDSKHFNLEVQVRRTDKNIVEAVQKVTSTLLNSIMTNQQKEKIKNSKNNIWKLMKYLHIYTEKEKEKEEQKNRTKTEYNCSWEQVLQNLSTHQQLKTKSQMAISDELPSKEQNAQNNPTKKIIKEFLSRLDYRLSQNSHFIATAFHNLVDLFIQMIDEVTLSLQKTEVKLKNAQKITHLKNVLTYQRKQYIGQKRYSKSVYIPVKTGMKFSTILKYKNWVNMLQESTSTTQETLSAIKNLVQFICDIKESMVTMSPLITQALLQKIIQKKIQQVKCLSSKKRQVADKSTIADIIAQQIPFHQLIDNLSMGQNMRQQFWKLFFAVINRILLLIRKFYIKATSHRITQSIQINRQDFAQIFMSIKEYIPPLSPEIQKAVKQQAKSAKTEGPESQQSFQM